MCIQGWWISISYFAWWQGTASFYTHKARNLNHFSIRWDNHHPCMTSTSTWTYESPFDTANFQRLFYNSTTWGFDSTCVFLSGRYKKAIVPSKFARFAPHPNASFPIPVTYQILWSLRGFKCDEFLFNLGIIILICNKTKGWDTSFWVQMMSKKRHEGGGRTFVCEHHCTHLYPTAAEITFGKDFFFARVGILWCFILL